MGVHFTFPHWRLLPGAAFGSQVLSSSPGSPRRLMRREHGDDGRGPTSDPGPLPTSHPGPLLPTCDSGPPISQAELDLAAAVRELLGGAALVEASVGASVGAAVAAVSGATSAVADACEATAGWIMAVSPFSTPGPSRASSPARTALPGSLSPAPAQGTAQGIAEWFLSPFSSPSRLRGSPSRPPRHSTPAGTAAVAEPGLAATSGKTSASGPGPAPSTGKADTPGPGPATSTPGKAEWLWSPFGAASQSSGRSGVSVGAPTSAPGLPWALPLPADGTSGRLDDPRPGLRYPADGSSPGGSRRPSPPAAVLRRREEPHGSWHAVENAAGVADGVGRERQRSPSPQRSQLLMLQACACFASAVGVDSPRVCVSVSVSVCVCVCVCVCLCVCANV